MRRFTIFWTGLMILPLLGLSQTRTNFEVPEQFYARTDRPYYILGEHLWYQVYGLFQSNEFLQSKVIYADLISPEGNIIHTQKLKMNQANAMGDFVVETHWNPGWYRIRIYSKWNMNFSPPPTYTLSFPVLNIPSSLPDALPKDSIPPSQLVQSPPQIELAGENGLAISLNQDSYSPRSTVLLDLGLKDPNHPLTSANVSISVVQLAFFKEMLQNQQRIKDVVPLEFSSYQRNTKYYPPEQNFQVNMKLTSETDKPITSNFIQGVVMQSGKMNYTQSHNGRAKIQFGEIYGSSPIQFFDPNPFAIHPRLKATLIEEDLPLPDPEPLVRPLPSNSGIQLYYQSYVDKLIIEKLYNTTEAFAPTTLSYPMLKRVPSFSIDTEDYIQFEDIFHFIGEAILSIQIKRPPKRFKSVVPFTKGPMAGKMFSFPIYSQGNYTEPQELQYVVPMMYSVNDYLFYDSDLLLDLEWDNVESVELYRVLEHLQFQFGPAGKSGVLGIRTKDRKTPRTIQNANHNIVFQGFHIPNTFQNPIYEDSEQEVSKIPDFRPINYWNPIVFVPPAGSTKLQFSTIDAPGWYLIRVEGVTNFGEPIWAEKLYQVSLPSAD
ncbi:MAG: hypothetical protein AAF587_18985 [Bacteroidota bacterium]